MMAARPQAVGYGMADSPAGLGAWMLVHRASRKWTTADPARLHRATTCWTTSLYWLTNTGTSAARLVWENADEGDFFSRMEDDEITVPVAVTVFGEDPFLPSGDMARRALSELDLFHKPRRAPLRGLGQRSCLRGKDAGAAFRSLRH